MKQVFLGLGSNVQPDHFLPRGIAELRRRLGPVDLSPVYSGASMGFAGDCFWNLVASLHTGLTVGELQTALREIEFAHGRPQQTTRTMPRTLDIDILTYGEVTGIVDGVELPRREILYHAFVLRPLADLAPDTLHPLAGRSYGELWQRFDAASQPLQEVALDLVEGS